MGTCAPSSSGNTLWLLLPKNPLREAEVVNAISGAVAGGLTATFVCPLDVLKTRLQVQSISQRKGGIFKGLSTIARAEGVRGCYRGLSPTLMALLPNWAVYFTVYDRMKTQLTKRAGGTPVPATPGVHMAAAASAGAATLLVTNPLWVVKTRMQTQNMRLDFPHVRPNRVAYRGTLDALRRITLEEGLVGLYSGLLPSMIGILHVAIQFPLYEWCKATVLECKAHALQEQAEAAAGQIHTGGMSQGEEEDAQRVAAGQAQAGGGLRTGFGLWNARRAGAGPGAGAGGGQALVLPQQPAQPLELTAGELVVTSAFSKMVASTVTYPHEVLRSYMHVSGSGPIQGLKDACSTVWRQDGVRGLYRGCAVNLLRTTPAAALTFTSFELIARSLRRLGQQGEAAAA